MNQALAGTRPGPTVRGMWVTSGASRVTRSVLWTLETKQRCGILSDTQPRERLCSQQALAHHGPVPFHVCGRRDRHPSTHAV